MVLAAAGGVDHAHLVELATKYFGNIEHGGDDVLNYEPGIFRQSSVSFLDVKEKIIFFKANDRR